MDDQDLLHNQDFAFLAPKKHVRVKLSLELDVLDCRMMGAIRGVIHRLAVSEDLRSFRFDIVEMSWLCATSLELSTTFQALREYNNTVEGHCRGSRKEV